jgi:hypothetical protein
MSKYRIGDITVSSTQPDFEQTLETAYLAKLRPECLCVGEKGLAMYIAQINNRYWVKRMPNSGGEHAVGCGSWETPEEFSGRSDLIGSALNYKEGEVALRLGFALSHRGKKKEVEPIEKSNKEKPTAKADADETKLTLRSLLHYLWDEAGLTSWAGRAGKPRDWTYVHDQLSMAASRKTVKHLELLRHLFIPQSPSKDRQAEIDADRRLRFAQVAGPDPVKKVQHLLMMVGAVNPMLQVGADYHITFKDLPNFPFIVGSTLRDQMFRNLGREMRLAQTLSPGHLVMLGTVRVEKEGTAFFEEIALMYVNEKWIPYENIYERDLLDELIKDERCFLRLLRYNRPSSNPMPSFLLTDCGDAPVSIYVIDAESSLGSAQVAASAAASKYESIIWNPKIEGAIPAFPQKSEGTGTAEPADPLARNPFVTPPNPTPSPLPAAA